MKNKATLAGFMIGFAALLSCCVEDKILAALFFSIALLYIRARKLSLYTGQTQLWATQQISFTTHLKTLLFNLSGVVVAVCLSILIFKSRPDAYTKYTSLVAAKWSYDWYYYLFSGICCGVLMTVATFTQTPYWVSSLCVMAFILGGFHHCIADFFYLNFTKTIYWLLVVAGNFFGGIIATLLKQSSSLGADK